MKTQMMNYELLRFPHKKLRAEVIKNYMKYEGYTKAICFSCGNAAQALSAEGIDTLHIGEKGELQPLKWWTQSEIKNRFTQYFDATSGHLPFYIMQDIAKRYKRFLGELPDFVYLPTGSGETLICLKIAYPDKNFIAVYNLDDATKFVINAPLNNIVKILAYDIIFDSSQN